MTPLGLIQSAPPVPCAPALRHELTSEQWRDMVALLPNQPELGFVALWADPAQVHALFWCGAPVLASVPVTAGLYAALSPARPGAALFERMIADLWGHQAADARDVRPWLDHGTWPMLRPLADRPAPNAGAPEVPEMLERRGEVLGLGPLPPTPAGPAHWRVTLDGDRVGTLEARLGYGHRGVVGLMRGKSPPGAAKLAARIDGAATVAHSTAFARAVEHAMATPVPPRAAALRTALLAVERVAVALHDRNAARASPAVQGARADLLAACAAVFGHRLLMDVVRPGGLHAEPGPAEVLDLALAAVPPAAALLAGVPGDDDGTARLHARLEAVDADVEEARGILAALPSGPIQAPLPHDSAEGLGRAEGPQGAVWHWVRLSGGLVGASFAADPAWHLLPAFEAAVPGAALTALPGLAARFGLHLAGMEL